MQDEADDLDLPDATVFLMDFPFEDAFERLKTETRWSQAIMSMYGRSVPMPRLTAWYGDAGCTYGYSGVRNDPMPWNDVLAEMRAQLETMLGTKFNSVLLNYYRDGQDSIGFHSDDERELGSQPIIASLSFGAERKFIFRHKKKSYRDVPIVLRDQSLLLMMGETQTNWLHGIPKVQEAGARINLTFRRVFPASRS